MVAAHEELVYGFLFSFTASLQLANCELLLSFHYLACRSETSKNAHVFLLTSKHQAKEISILEFQLNAQKMTAREHFDFAPSRGNE